MTDKTLTFMLMDAPFESARTTTALRLVDLALRRGFPVNVFAYEGAAALSFVRQAPHANAVHGRDAAEEDHPLTHHWVAALLELAAERGVGETIPGVRRGGPPDFFRMASESRNTLVIATR